MSCTSASPALLAFPCLHPDLALASLPETVRFLDPGLADASDPRLFRPAGLPLDAAALAGVVREFERLRAEVRDPKEIALLADASAGHFFHGTSFAVLEELKDQLEPERVARRRLVSSQLTLCLAFLLEESLAQLAVATDLESRYRSAMAESLGLDTAEAEETGDEALLQGILPIDALPTPAAMADEFGMPWQRLLSPFWALLPTETGLVTTHADMAATWRDAGLPVSSLPAAQVGVFFPGVRPSGEIESIRETGWRLLGKTRPDPEAPWLDAPRTVVVLQP